MCSPDGLAFSRCGRWLATANHGDHSVSIFERRSKLITGGRLRYGPEPVAIISDPHLRYPHSVAFTPRNQLLVTNAGANYFCLYSSRKGLRNLRWSASASLQKAVNDENAFREVNAGNKMEGGPKGIDTHGNTIAVCSPEFGAKLYSFQEVAA